MTRVLVTGSRDWEDADEIGWQLLQSYNEHGSFTLISGACPTGADRIAEQIVEDWWGISGMEIERHPANWARWGKAAGFMRNTEMVKSNPDYCLAFILNDSRGATNTVMTCRKYGVPVRIFRRYS